jgi:hypothetical protein
MKKIITTIAIWSLPLIPVAAYSGDRLNSNSTLHDVIDLIIRYVGYAIPVILTLAVVSFIWGIYRRFFKEDAKPGEAGAFVLYGVLGFFVILAFWGLVNILLNTFGFDNSPGVMHIPFVGPNVQQNPYSGVNSF